ncbi:acyltransferase [Sphingosinicella sp. CPCC 101087]|uniref:acyltransferase family protein n=1 Tax=Sphingosinicella sp. CPCC 101087 TaxID=2497754 RepID=UPI001FB0EBC2|nr:acyltransferase [Sphingosinicella sp. CPCC 101087]
MARSSTPIARHYGLDWLRIAAFLLLIFYHAGMVFAPGEWLVKASRTIEAAEWPMLLVQPWRMPLLFLVSGFASHALLSRSRGTGEYVRSRSRRLLLPLAFGMLAIVPPQTWVGLALNHGYSHGLLHFWTVDWLGFRAVEGVWLPSQEHLWFVAYLWTYTMVLVAAVLVVPEGVKAKGRALVARLASNHRLLWLPLVPLLPLRLVLLFTVPETHGLLHDWVSDLTYLPAFLFGFVLAGTPALWPAILRMRWPALAVAATAYAVLIAVEVRFPDARTHAAQALHRDALLVMGWSAILVLLGVAHQWFNRDHPMRAKLTEAVFPFYLVHQTIIVLVAWWLHDSGLSPTAFFAVLVAATFAGCALFYEGGRRIGPLRPLIGLAPAVRRPGTLPAGFEAAREAS